MTKKEIAGILADLYEIDPELQAHEKELIPLIQTLLKHDPSRTPDEQFVSELRTRLRERAHQLSSEKKSAWNFPLPVFLGSLATLLIAVPVTYWAASQSGTPTTLQVSNNAENAPALTLFGYDVSQTKDKAFGSFSGFTPGSGAEGGRGGMGGGGGDAMMAGDAAVSNEKMIAPGMPYPNSSIGYTFDGSIPALPSSVSVLKKQPQNSTIPLETFAKSLNVQGINIRSFEGSTVDSVSFVQQKKYGYMLSLQLRDGTFSLSQNWEQWPHPENSCQTEACFRSFALSPSDIPADDVLIKIAQDFMKEHSVDLSEYGAPEVDNNWRRDYERMVDKTYAYVPETQRVVYPLLVDGKPVFDTSGNKTGLSVGVHVREKKVADLYGIMNRTFLASSYDTVPTEADIKEYLSKQKDYPGDTVMTTPAGEKVTVTSLTLGNPVLAHSIYYRYQNNTSEELVVPSLIFPINDTTNLPYLYRRQIVVPLLKELLEMPDPGVAVPLDTEVAPRG